MLKIYCSLSSIVAAGWMFKPQPGHPPDDTSVHLYSLFRKNPQQK
jgi:hypothetical protein